MASVKNRYWLHILLFFATLVSTAYTGASVFIGRATAWDQGHLLLGSVSAEFVHDGLVFALSLLGFLTVHEFGHYVAARRHHVSTSLPFYIPSPLIGIGTLGALIRIRQQVPTTRKLFDIGAAGPIAGFLVALGTLLYALATLPSPDYMFGVPGHEELQQFIAHTGQFPDQPLRDPSGLRMTVGTTPLYWSLAQLFPNVPPMYEMYHYPMLFASWLALFFTALNLLPVGATGWWTYSVCNGGPGLAYAPGPRLHDPDAVFHGNRDSRSRPGNGVRFSTVSCQFASLGRMHALGFSGIPDGSISAADVPRGAKTGVIWHGWNSTNICARTHGGTCGDTIRLCGLAPLVLSANFLRQGGSPTCIVCRATHAGQEGPGQHKPRHIRALL